MGVKHVEGDKSHAICPHCRQLVASTFRRRDVPLSDGSGLVRDLLVVVCDVCDTVVAIPAQSTSAVKEARR
jgi:RNase P subunit RPR2